MSKKDQDHDFIDRIYAVAMEPERFRELAEIWRSQLDAKDGGLGQEYVGEADLLEKHFQRADTILSLITSNADSLPVPLQEKLNREPQAMVAILDNGKISALNGAGALQFGVEEGDNVDDLPFDEFGLRIIKEELRRLMKPGASLQENVPGLYRLDKHDGAASFLVTFTEWETVGARRFMLLKSTDFQWPGYLTPMIKTAFNLTEAEANVVKLIVEGYSIEKVADARQSSVSTVRSQIRSLYEKTSTNNQSEFIRMAIGLTTLQLAGQEEVNGVFLRDDVHNNISYPLPEHRRLLSLSGGRVLDYAVFGPDDGKPCMFFHNAFYGDIWPKKLAQLAEHAGLKIILPARGYFGQTTPYDKGVSSFAQTNQDVEALRAYLDIPKMVLVSQTTGFDYSLEYVNQFPKRVKAMVGVAPSLPFSSVKEQDAMPKFAKFISTVAGRNPRMLEFVAKSGYAFHNRIGSKRFMETILAQCPPDLKVVRDPVNRDAIVRGFQYSTSHKHKAFFYDYLDLIDDKTNKTLAVKCPLIAIIGADDKNSRMKRYESLKGAGSDISLKPAQGGGEMLFFTHAQLIIDAIVEASG